MEFQAASEGGILEPIRPASKILAKGAAALAVLLLSGFVTEANAQNGANSIVVRARGTSGAESITLRIDNSNVATWTLSTAYQTYSASTSLSGGGWPFSARCC